MPIDFIGYLYAAIVAAGGVMGCVKAGSIMSLGAGLAFGIILGLGAQYNSHYPPRPLLQFCTSLMLASIMGVRWNRSGKLMPAGIICVISITALIRNVITYYQYFPLLRRN